ncbi:MULTISPECIES: ankyrin repeat domain-containing protein [Stenotrophomonas]|uniref:ankyrin repeat domain-containing protein n=2 Tax=Pseudomonadota TaxID=1224 RepID=UPI000B674D5C|nr:MULTISPECIES: ankyrin repeat domain-containing protein [Stenotrophomonas]MDH2177896.1 ankyrin repeat domain-containing protein [Stenotrophomonas sp. GD03654]OWQ59808.1 hypothetical protein CEE59_05960 [Stenotrophomonas maltophilia]WNV16830.1 ankyrin repeat domain-containing protein [Stenotrophomonas maltophilia]
MQLSIVAVRGIVMTVDVFQLAIEKRYDELLAVIDRGEVEDLDANSPDNCFTLLHYAVLADNSLLIRDLIRRGANVSVVDANRMTPLAWPSSAHSVKALLDAGADINAIDDFGVSPIFHYWGSDDGDAIELLVQAGANVNARNKDGETVLMHHFMNASEMCANEVVSVSALLSAGADVNAVNGSGDTVLHLAADGSIDEDLIEVLLAAGANPSAVNASGLTPSDVANDPGIKAIIQRAVLNAELLSLIESSPDRIKRGDGGI